MSTKTKKTFVKPNHLEHLHYLTELSEILEVKLGKPGYFLLSDLFFLSIAADHGVTELGEKQVERARRNLQKFCKKYTGP